MDISEFKNNRKRYIGDLMEKTRTTVIDFISYDGEDLGLTAKNIKYMIDTINNMSNKIKEMEKTINDLQLQIKYMPNYGTGYQEAKENFEGRIKKIDN